MIKDIIKKVNYLNITLKQLLLRVIIKNINKKRIWLNYQNIFQT